MSNALRVLKYNRLSTGLVRVTSLRLPVLPLPSGALHLAFLLLWTKADFVSKRAVHNFKARPKRQNLTDSNGPPTGPKPERTEREPVPPIECMIKSRKANPIATRFYLLKMQDRAVSQTRCASVITDCTNTSLVLVSPRPVRKGLLETIHPHIRLWQCYDAVYRRSRVHHTLFENTIASASASRLHTVLETLFQSLMAPDPV